MTDLSCTYDLSKLQKILTDFRSAAGHDGVLIHGDNLKVLQCLASELSGAVDLVYIDPPFATANEFPFWC